MSLLYEKVVQEDLNVGTSAAVSVTNPGGGTLTGTQIGIHSVAVGQTAWEATWNPSSIAAGSYEATDVTVPGAAVDDFVLVKHSAILTNAMMISGHVSAADTVKVILFNPTAGALNVGSGTLGVLVFKARS
jgi:succinyl-CoA synthetase alpha subunit